MDKNLPLVSVLILSYNQSDYILEAINSVLSQTYKNIEIILLDDCSVDDTKRIIQKLEMPGNLKFISIFNEKNLGIVKNLNQGCRLAKGKYIALLAADDKWTETKLEMQVDFMERNTDVVITGGYMNIIDSNGKIIYQEDEHNLILKNLTFEQIIQDNILPAGSLLLRRDYLESVNFFDERFYYEDWPLLLKTLSNHKKVVKLPFVFLIYRKHSSNTGSVKNIKFAYEQLRVVMQYQNYANFKEIFYFYSKIFLKSLSYYKNKMFGFRKFFEILSFYNLRFFFRFLFFLFFKWRT